MTDAYHKARKLLGLFGGLLIAWELVGVDLSEIEYAKALKSPQAAPYVLIALILYFGFRLSIEWKLSDPEMRTKKAAQVDVWVAFAIATTALGLNGWQQFSRIRVADNWITLAVASVAPMILALVGFWFMRRARRIIVAQGEQLGATLHELVRGQDSPHTPPTDQPEAEEGE